MVTADEELQLDSFIPACFSPRAIDLPIMIDLLDDKHLAMCTPIAANFIPLVIICAGIQLGVLVRQLHLSHH